MMRFLRKISANDGGVATIELALIAPVLATLVVGVADVTTAFNRKVTLEQAVQRAVERVMQTTAEYTVADNIKEEVHRAAGVPKANVSVDYFLTCNGVVKSADLDCTGTEAEIRYTIVSAFDTYTPVIPLDAIGFGGPITLRVETEMRTQ
jgi:Flp pilus assembly protein TadG